MKALLLCLVLAGCQAPSVSGEAITSTQDELRLPATRVLILRHAEKQNPNDWNTDLREPEGFARAQAWAELLSSESPSALFVSNLQRTQHTLQPAADFFEMTLSIRPQVAPNPDRPTSEDSVALANEILKDHLGKTVIVCWHTPLVEDIAAALGVEEVPSWDHDTYDHLWLVTIPKRGKPSLEDLAPDFQLKAE